MRDQPRYRYRDAIVLANLDLHSPIRAMTVGLPTFRLNERVLMDGHSRGDGS